MLRSFFVVLTLQLCFDLSIRLFVVLKISDVRFLGKLFDTLIFFFVCFVRLFCLCWSNKTLSCSGLLLLFILFDVFWFVPLRAAVLCVILLHVAVSCVVSLGGF